VRAGTRYQGLLRY